MKAALLRSLLLGLVLAACGGPAPAPAELIIGTGETGFEPLAQDQDVTLVRGPQGGVHLWMSLRAQGLQPQKVWLDVETQLGQERRQSRNITALEQKEDCAELIGWPVILDERLFVDGDTVGINVRLTDETGEAAGATVQVRVHLPAAAQNG